VYKAVTRAIAVTVEPFHLDEQSRPDQGRWVFGYRIRIENQGVETVQLVARHWRITDSLGRQIEVKGTGVVGEQPMLRPGESFEYTSGTPLPTASGIMIGTYQMQTEAGESFEVMVPAFSLDAPGIPARLN
jgi:ApaG protein